METGGKSSSSTSSAADKWAALGQQIVNVAQGCDAGQAAFDEVLVAREQLETMIDGAGFGDQLSVALFGSVVVNSLVELGGDVDFVAIADREPDQADASSTVVSIAKELRRLGLRSTAIPRARVPIVRTDRVSPALPGTPVHGVASSAVFRYQRPSTALEQSALETVLREQYCATRVEWNGSSTLIAHFPHTSEAVRALSFTKSCGQLDIPLRLPVDPKHGPEIYRYSFDLCLHSSGLQNSYLFRSAVLDNKSEFPYARHLLLFIKRWSRACGIVHTHDGMLASYAVSVMVIHFLVRCGVIAPLQLSDAKDPTALPKYPDYRPLEGLNAGGEGNNNNSSSTAVATLGFLAAHYLAYFAHGFQYDSQVVCTTTKRNLHKSVLRWGLPPAQSLVNGASGPAKQRAAVAAAASAAATTVEPTREETLRFLNPTKPPFFSFCIKDPYNAENIARNISPVACSKIQKLHDYALQMVAKDGGRDPKYVVHSLVDANGPAVAGLKRKALAAVVSSSSSSIGSGGGAGQQRQSHGGSSSAFAASSEDPLSPEAEARREITKMAFESRKQSLSKVGEATARSHEQTKAAQDLTRSLVDWIRAAEPSSN